MAIIICKNIAIGEFLEEAIIRKSIGNKKPHETWGLNFKIPDANAILLVDSFYNFYWLPDVPILIGNMKLEMIRSLAVLGVFSYFAWFKR